MQKIGSEETGACDIAADFTEKKLHRVHTLLDYALADNLVVDEGSHAARTVR